MWLLNDALFQILKTFQRGGDRPTNVFSTGGKGGYLKCTFSTCKAQLSFAYITYSYSSFEQVDFK